MIGSGWGVRSLLKIAEEVERECFTSAGKELEVFDYSLRIFSESGNEECAIKGQKGKILFSTLAKTVELEEAEAEFFSNTGELTSTVKCSHLKAWENAGRLEKVVFEGNVEVNLVKHRAVIRCSKMVWENRTARLEGRVSVTDGENKLEAGGMLAKNSFTDVLLYDKVLLSYSGGEFLSTLSFPKRVSVVADFLRLNTQSKQTFLGGKSLTGLLPKGYLPEGYDPSVDSVTVKVGKTELTSTGWEISPSAKKFVSSGRAKVTTELEKDMSISEGKVEVEVNAGIVEYHWDSGTCFLSGGVSITETVGSLSRRMTAGYAILSEKRVEGGNGVYIVETGTPLAGDSPVHISSEYVNLDLEHGIVVFPKRTSVSGTDFRIEADSFSFFKDSDSASLEGNVIVDDTKERCVAYAPAAIYRVKSGTFVFSPPVVILMKRKTTTYNLKVNSTTYLVKGESLTSPGEYFISTSEYEVKGKGLKIHGDTVEMNDEFVLRTSDVAMKGERGNFHLSTRQLKIEGGFSGETEEYRFSGETLEYALGESEVRVEGELTVEFSEEEKLKTKNAILKKTATGWSFEGYSPEYVNRKLHVEGQKVRRDEKETAILNAEGWIKEVKFKCSHLVYFKDSGELVLEEAEVRKGEVTALCGKVKVNRDRNVYTFENGVKLRRGEDSVKGERGKYIVDLGKLIVEGNVEVSAKSLKGSTKCAKAVFWDYNSSFVLYNASGGQIKV